MQKEFLLILAFHYMELELSQNLVQSVPIIIYNPLIIRWSLSSHPHWGTDSSHIYVSLPPLFFLLVVVCLPVLFIWLPW